VSGLARGASRLICGSRPAAGAPRRRRPWVQKIDQAYDRMVKGDVKYRFVIDTASLRL